MEEEQGSELGWAGVAQSKAIRVGAGAAEDEKTRDV